VNRGTGEKEIHPQMTRMEKMKRKKEVGKGRKTKKRYRFVLQRLPILSVLDLGF
jgi:hypothetical protein